MAIRSFNSERDSKLPLVIRASSSTCRAIVAPDCNERTAFRLLPSRAIRASRLTWRAAVHSCYDVRASTENQRMACSSRLHGTLAAAIMLAGIGLSSAAQAETCSIAFTVIKAGFVVGGQGGSGVMRCGGHSYRFSVGGLSYGFMIG